MNTAPAFEKLSIAWIHPQSFDEELAATTYLEPTRELREMGCDVTLIASGREGRREYHGVEVLCIPRPDVFLVRHVFFHLKTIRWLLAHWRDIDAVVFHEVSTLWVLPLRLVRRAKGTRIPVLVMDTRTVHMPREDTQTIKIRLRGVFLRIMGKLSNRWADGRTAITRRMATEVNIPEHKLWGIWPSGVRPEQFAPAQTSRRWPLPDEPVQIIYVGVLEYERGLMTFCRAVMRAQAEGMCFNFTLVGDGRERAELEALAATSGCIRVLPPVPHGQVPQVLSQGHIGVLPFPDETKFQVSSPIKLFEYMAAGLPILATKIACHTDVIGDNTYVFWAEQTDEDGLLAALRRVWESRQRLPEMGHEAVRAVDAWTWRAAAEKLKKALEKGLVQSL